MLSGCTFLNLQKTKKYNDEPTGLYLFTSWNLTHLIDNHGRLKEYDIDSYSVIVNRRKKPLERFNRKLN